MNSYEEKLSTSFFIKKFKLYYFNDLQNYSNDQEHLSFSIIRTLSINIRISSRYLYILRGCYYEINYKTSEYIK